MKIPFSDDAAFQAAYANRFAQGREVGANFREAAINAARHPAVLGAAVPLGVGGGMAIYDAMTGEDETSPLGYVGGGLGSAGGVWAGGGLGSMIGSGAGMVAGGLLGGASRALMGRPQGAAGLIGTGTGALIGGTAGYLLGGNSGARGGYGFGEEMGDRANALLNRHLGY